MLSSIPLILCVDDELMCLEAHKVLLEHAGYQVLTASNGSTGIEVFRQHPVCAVILDFAMPGMTGGEVAGRMRQLKPEVPLVLHSGNLSFPQPVLQAVDVLVPKGEGGSALLKGLRQVLDLTTKEASRAISESVPSMTERPDLLPIIALGNEEIASSNVVIAGPLEILTR